MNQTQVFAEIGRLHLEVLDLRMQLAEAHEAIARLEGRGAEEQPAEQDEVG